MQVSDGGAVGGGIAHAAGQILSSMWRTEEGKGYAASHEM